MLSLQSISIAKTLRPNMPPKTIDLSARQLPSITRTTPIFSRQSHEINSLIAAGVFDIFTPNSSCTVQRIICQVLGDCTLQLLESGSPISIPVTAPANTVIQFPGLLLPGNSKLSLLLSTDVTVEYDVTWIKDFYPDTLFNHLFIAKIS